MAKRKVIWFVEAKSDMFEIMDYYYLRNKSKTYAAKLYSEIKTTLKNLDFSVSLPQKTNVQDLFYFTLNHISVCFSIRNDDIIVKLIIDDRRNPESLKTLLKKLD
jgi:hypothetical protein